MPTRAPLALLLASSASAVSPQTASCNGCSGHGVCLASGACKCDVGFEGTSCQTATGWQTSCVKDCMNKGQCRHGTCLCEPGFIGEACDVAVPICPASCSGHGECRDMLCSCVAGYTGDDCSVVAEVCPNNCMGHGVCNRGACECDLGYVGHDCSKVVRDVCPGNCAGHGVCAGGKCACDPGYDGPSCERVVESPGCPASCSGRGSCIGGSCVCHLGFTGESCSHVADAVTTSCPNSCTGRGTCGEDGACSCYAGFGGADCSQAVVLTGVCAEAGCSGHGFCLRGLCSCDRGFYGRNCEHVQRDFCPLACSGRGECRYAPRSAGPLPGVAASPWAGLNAAEGGVSGQGVCICRAASSGPGCEHIELGLSARDCPNFCSGHGLCREHGCACEAGYGGHDCGVACRDECSGNGVCDESGMCACTSGYFGPSCAETSPCPNGCSGRGLCRANATSGAHECFCQQGWTGAADCSVQDLECPNGCSGHGNCNNGTCECFAGYHGLLCATTTANYRAAKLQQHQAWRAQLVAELCPGNCSGHGTCLKGECLCARGYTGVACAAVESARALELSCPLDCRGHGRCVQGVCMCDDGYAGATCLRTLSPTGLPSTDVRLREVEEQQQMRNDARRRSSGARLSRQYTL